MITLSDKMLRTLELLKKCFNVIRNSSVASLIILLMLLFHLTIIIGFLLFEYHLYDIHVFDFSSLKALLHFKFWEHIGHVVLILLFLISTFFIHLYLELALSYSLIENLKGSNVSFLQTFRMPRLRFKEMLRMSTIRSFKFLENFFQYTNFTSHFENVRTLAEGDFEQKYTKYSAPSGILLLPIILEKNIHVLKALELSQQLIEGKFGTNLVYNFSINTLKLSLFLFILSCSFIFIHFYLGFQIFLTVIFAVLIAKIIEKLMDGILITLSAALYNYCNNIPLQNFSAKFLTSLLVNKS